MDTAIALRGAVVVAAVVGLACGGGGGGGGDPAGPDPGPDPGPGPGTGDVVEVMLTENLRFEPANVTIAPGTTVRWVNTRTIFHTVTPDGHDEWQRRTTTSPGTVLEHTFQDAGSFDYFCEPHLSVGMVGSITVEG